MPVSSQQVQTPVPDLRQLYLQSFDQQVNSPQFLYGDDSTKRNMIGSFIYHYVGILLKQVSPVGVNGEADNVELTQMTAKITGMII